MAKRKNPFTRTHIIYRELNEKSIDPVTTEALCQDSGEKSAITRRLPTNFEGEDIVYARGDTWFKHDERTGMN